MLSCKNTKTFKTDLKLFFCAESIPLFKKQKGFRKGKNIIYYIQNINILLDIKQYRNGGTDFVFFKQQAYRFTKRTLETP